MELAIGVLVGMIIAWIVFILILKKNTSGSLLVKTDEDGSKYLFLKITPEGIKDIQKYKYVTFKNEADSQN